MKWFQGARRNEWITQIYEEYKVPMVRYATKLLRNQNDAEDLVHRVFERLMSLQRPRLRTLLPDQQYHYLMASLRNIHRNHVNSAVDYELRECSLNELSELINYETPEEVALTKDDYELVLKIIRNLPAQEREALGLSLKGMPGEALAELMGVSHGTMRTRLSRIRKKVRTEFYRIREEQERGTKV